MILYTTAIYRPNFLWFFKAASPSLLWGSGHQRHAWGNSTRPIANTRGVHQQMSQRHCLAQRLCFLAPLDLKISWNFVSGSCAAEHEARQQVKGRLIIFIIELKGNVYMILHDPLKLEHARNQSCFSDNVHGRQTVQCAGITLWWLSRLESGAGIQRKSKSHKKLQRTLFREGYRIGQGWGWRYGFKIWMMITAR